MMKPKKLSLFLILSNVILLLACILLLVLLLRPGASGSFQPVSTPVSDSALVGQMRTTKFYAESGMFDTTDNARFRLEFVEIVPGGCTDEGEEGYDLVRIKRTVKRETSGGPDDNFWLLRYCPEDGYWYALYYPNYVVRSVAYSLGVGSSIQECAVPPELIADPGLYAIGFEGVGCCQFEIE